MAILALSAFVLLNTVVLGVILLKCRKIHSIVCR